MRAKKKKPTKNLTRSTTLLPTLDPGYLNMIKVYSSSMCFKKESLISLQAAQLI